MYDVTAMNTTEPTGEGGGGGEGESATMTNVEQSPSPSTPITGTSVPMQAAAQQQQQPQQHPPPSPLSGCYLLVVLPEPHTAQHKDLILNRLAKVRTWDIKNDDMRSTKKCTMAEERRMEKKGHEAAKKGTDTKE
ncbi:Microtubule-associated protein futsch [Acromyrmex echinatior]|uniref:Microtubule-associated protein futsch n=1 Tax=Acromyrmex echinatior TaxID=103372 RepID=F4W986_ACREC|nr:Microtubule-associated protein futsch [Acromyrmex echinatior]